MTSFVPRSLTLPPWFTPAFFIPSLSSHCRHIERASTTSSVSLQKRMPSWYFLY